MASSSRYEKKWWHASLEIKDRVSNNVLSEFHTGSVALPAINNNSSVSAYSSNAIHCTIPITIPVPSFNILDAGGYFLFRPTLDSLANSIININSYQESINLGSRRIFSFHRYASYNNADLLCAATSPNAYDEVEYENVVDTVNSNVFQYPLLDSYESIGCCSIDLIIPGVNLPAQGVSGRATRVWYLTKDGSSNYHLLSYDFALVSNQLVNRGLIDISKAPSGIIIYDITWTKNDNSLIALTSDGIRRIFPGNAIENAVLGDLISIIDCANCNVNGNIFPIVSSDTFGKTLEYNYYNNKLYMFATRNHVNNLGTIIVDPYYFEMEYNGSSIIIHNNVYASNNTSGSNNSIAGFSFDSSGESSLCITSNSLYSVSLNQSTFGNTSLQGTANNVTGIITISLAENPDETSTDRVLYGANIVGQQFIINQVTGNPSLISAPLLTPGVVVGSTTTLNGEDTRVSPFPFTASSSPWLFVVQVSASMAGDKIYRVKTAIVNMLSTYVRYGDRITILWYKDINGQITKDLRTYADANEVIDYINTYFVASSQITNFYSAFSSISQTFTGLKNLFIISDGACSDCGTTNTEWQLNLHNSIQGIIQTNPQVKFTIVGVSVTNNEQLQYIAQQSGGTYVSWN